MPICPKRRAKRAAALRRQAASERLRAQTSRRPAMGLALQFVLRPEGCRRRNPALGALHGAAGLCWPGGGAGVGHDPRPEAPARAAVAGSSGIDRRTLERWRQWWLGLFVESSFWREARARFMPPLCQKTLPFSLCLSFEVEDRRDRFWTCSSSWPRSPPRPPGKSWLCKARFQLPQRMHGDSRR